MPKGVPNGDKKMLLAPVTRSVYRAFKVHCLIEEKDEGGVVSLALARYLETDGGPQVKALLREEQP